MTEPTISDVPSVHAWRVGYCAGRESAIREMDALFDLVDATLKLLHPMGASGEIFEQWNAMRIKMKERRDD